MLFKKLQRWWGIICILGMLIPAISQAQCVYPGSNISFAKTGQNTSAGYTTRYVLTTASGIIISVHANSTTAIPAPNQAGTYRIYAVNYQTANAPTLAPGINISTVTTGTACAALSAPLEFCVNDVCVLPGASITFTNAGNTTTSGYGTIYALVNAATGNIIQQVTSPFAAPATPGSYNVYAISYQGTAPTLTPGNNISTVTGTCVSKSTEPMQFSVCTPATISGNVFNDANGNTLLETGENFTTMPGTMYMHLVDYNGLVIGVTTVAANGSYSLPAGQGQTYSLMLSPVSYAEGTDVGSFAVDQSLPTGWVRTGENLGNTGTGDGNANGWLEVTIPASTTTITNANFGIEHRPVAGSGTASMINQNGTTQHTVPTTAFTSGANSTDPTPGNVASIRITSFPAGANSIVINGTTYTTTGAGGTTIWPGAGVTVPTGPNGNPTQTITVDPTANDATQVVISFVAIDNAGVASSNTGTATINFIADPIRSGNNVVAGTVYNDYDGPANGINNLSGANLSGLNAVLVGDDGLGNQVVYGVTEVSNVDGSFQFLNVPDGNFTVVITTQNPAIRDPAPTSQLPAGWLHTGENWGGGTGNDGLANGVLAVSTIGGVDAVDVDFGIRQNVSLDLGNLPIAGSGAPVIWPQATATMLSLDLSNTNRAWLGDNNSYPNQANVSNVGRNGGLTLSSDDIDLSGLGTSGNPFVFAGFDWRQEYLDLKFNITVNGNAGSGDRTVYYGLWFDANGNGSFTDADDIFVTGSQAYGGPVSVTMPSTFRNGGTNSGAHSGAIRLVATKDNTTFTKAQNGNVNVINGEVEDYYVNYPTVLPVNISLFTVIKQNNEAVLNWTTASEQNNRGFYVERSTDGANWTSLGFVSTKATNGNSNAKLNYAFTDKQPVAAINYYRLKQTDVDNKVGYSETRQLDFNNSVSLVKIYPNPAKSVISITGVEAGSTIRMEDALGKTVLSTIRTGTVQSVSTIDVSRFPQGIYMVTIYKKDGTIVTRKVVKE